MSFDVIIIGGGIIGCTTAYFLAQRGLKPAIVEPGDVGGSTTSNSFAWANATTKTSDADYHRLNADGMAGYRALIDRFGAKALGINPAGSLQVVRRSDGPGHRAMLADAEALAGFAYPCQVLDLAALSALELHLRFAEDAEALHCPSDMIIDAPRFARFMADQAIAMGGRLIRGHAEELIADDAGRVQGVTVDGDHLQAGAVILAAGPDTQAVLTRITGYGGFASRFPLRQVPGFLLTTPPMNPMPLSRLIYTSTSNELHVLPTENSGLRIGSDDVDGMIWGDRSVEAMRRAGTALLERADALIPGLRDRVDLADCRLGVGIRPYPEDGKSIAGAWPGAEGLHLIATHSGVTLAPVIGALMAQYVATKEVPTQLAPYGLTRFAGFGA